jgi:cell division protease FtsH
VSILLSTAVLWTAPGLAAHAAAAAIVGEIRVAPLAPVAGFAPTAMSAAVMGTLSAPALTSYSAPSVFASPLSAAPLAGAPAASAVPLAAAALPVAAPALAARPAAADAPRPGALDSAREGAAPVAENAAPSRLGRIFDGTMSAAMSGAVTSVMSGATRLAYTVMPSPADGPEFSPPSLPGRARVSVTLVKGDAETYAAALRRLEQMYGFRAERAPVIKDGQATVAGTVSTEHVLAMSRSKDVAGLEVLAGAPSPSDGPRLRAAASRLVKAVTPTPVKEPFVAATRRVAELEKLAKTDPEKAYELAVDYISTGRETRREVRYAALRVLDGFPLSKTLPFYEKTLAGYADPRVQNAKAAGADPIWYIQRHILQRYAREAAELRTNATAVAAARGAYADRNASVRLAAAAALRAMGEDPGPENEYLSPSSTKGKMVDNGPFGNEERVINSELDAYPDPNVTVAPGWQKRLLKGFIAIMAAAAVMYGISQLGGNHGTTPAPAPAPTHITRGVPAPRAPAISAAPSPENASGAPSIGSPSIGTPSAPVATPAAEPSEKQILEQIAQSEERIAKTQEAELAAQQAAKSGGFMSGIMGMVVNVLIFMGVFWLIRKLFTKGGASGPGGMTASTEAKAEVEKPTQRFTDVEGVDEALVDVSEVVDFMRDPSRFTRMGAKAPKGILFEGPPGTGKTLMARALAGETNAAFFAVSGSDFVELFVGMGARRVRELIAKASNHRPAIVFIDEIDAVGKARGSGGLTGGNDEREQTINALLTGMDGFDNSGGIIFVAATNRADTLDPALLRPGRFDRKVHVGKPHMGGREAIATIHAKNKRLAPTLDLAYVARRTAGLAGADIEGIMNEAALQAVRRGSDAIEMQDVDEAIDRGTIGAARNLPMPDALRKRVAYHEAGHVLANLLNEDVSVRQRVNKFTIVPHGSGALGFAEMGSEEGDKYLYTKEELEARIDHALGGMVAEKLIFGKAEKIPAEFSPDWSTGPGSDLEQATRVARTMVQTLGMGEETGLAVTAPDPRDPMGRSPFGDAVAEKTWRETNKILAASYKRVTDRLRRNRHVLEALTQAVLTKETLIGDEIEEIVRKAGPVGPGETPPAQ